MNIQTITMIQEHIDLVAEVLKDSRPEFPTDGETYYPEKDQRQWTKVMDFMCIRFEETYPLFNEAEFRKKCGEGET